LDGRRYQKSLGTRDWQRAIRKLAALEDPQAPRLKPIPEAIAAFQSHILNLERSTQRKYGNVLAQFAAFCQGTGLNDLADCRVEHLDAYRASRKIARTTAQKELETLRAFFAFCRERNWIGDNPAKRIKSARNVRPAEVVPYTPEEISRIIGACEIIGRGPYERLRAHAMVLVLNNTALRVSDVATLARDRVRDGRVLVRTQKTGEPVYLEVWAETQVALDCLPRPRGAGEQPRYFFWNGTTSRRAVVGIVERTLAAVFRASGIEGAHAHRFRHTLATRLLGMGASEQDVADVLGNTPAIVRKHYSKWSIARQERIDRLMRAAQPATFVQHEEKRPVIH
jgi:site-specific recombinase XerD